MTPTDDDELRRRVAAAYDDVLREPVPDRLNRLLAEPAPVVDLAAERARRARPAPVDARRGWGWARWGGMAASLAIGVVAGVLFTMNRGDDTLVKGHGGQLVAGAGLARALDAQLASDPAARVAVQLSFVDRAGRYCRTFSADALAGLACREGARWEVVATAQAESRPGGAMRQAASSLPRPVLDAVDARIAGNALDAPQERAARDHGWRR
jgi:hypothetical protein